MAFLSNIHDKDYKVEVGTPDQHQVVLDGKTHEIDWQKIAPLAANAQGRASQGGRYTLLIEGRSYEIIARRLENQDETDETVYEIVLGEQRFEVRVADERERTLLGSLQRSHEVGEIKVRAPMPGLVLSIPKAAGESVERGETVVILEAMKMENDLATPHAGTIKEVLASKGQTVNQGDVLLMITGN